MKCFIIAFKKITLAGIESRFLQIPEIFEPRQNLAGVTLAMGQQQNPAIRVARPTASPAAVCQESPGRRKERRWHRGHPRNKGVHRENCSAKPVVDLKTETLGPLPPIEWPDANGFYANLVLRQVRARFQPGWNSSGGHGRLPAEWKVGSRSIVAQSARAKSPSPLEGRLTVAEVASAGALREPFETLLAELAQRKVQLPASGRCS